ncbi:MAG TPA: DUF2500 domain-containing protein [Bacillota bacterium]|nr:DUF2500 domain-containing protein [Bacillota bacterium]HNT03240.1 DUF2500 domain-containing protein [Bacillota bacterium]HPA54736.1 DUF2500 domain-containing protein [Bacillota bacterium]HPX68464.1 DUF2500 domain-containing protein [Bacillota bacterium]HQA64998.1 DUF2500 domain-containing protein [Bacillota bacterium]
MGFTNSFNDFLFSVVPFFMFIIFVIVTMTFITSFTEGLGQYLRNKSAPKKTIPARLAAKRTHDWGGYGDTDIRISYYAAFETENGERLEFPVSSSFSEMYAEGDTGMLTYKGTKFIDFKIE